MDMIASLGFMNVLIVGGLSDACFLGYLTTPLTVLKMIIPLPHTSLKKVKSLLNNRKLLPWGTWVA